MEYPTRSEIPGQMMCVLPTVGGLASARIDRFAFMDTVSVGGGSASVAGQEDPSGERWATILEIHLEEVSILGQVTIDQIVLRLASSQAWTLDTRERSAAGTRMEGLRLQGRPVRVRFDDTLEGASHDSLVRAIEVEDHRLMIDGNVIVIPGFGKVRLADLSRKDDQVHVTMCSFEGDSAGFRGRVDLASGTLNGYVLPAEERTIRRAVQHDVPVDRETVRMNEDELGEVMEALRTWAGTHPTPNEPFIFLMGKVLTPKEFLLEVAQRSKVGQVYLNSLAKLARQNHERPVQAVRRAVEANQPENE